MTSPWEIAKYTGLDIETIKKWLSKIAKKHIGGKVVVIGIGRTDMVIMLTR